MREGAPGGAAQGAGACRPTRRSALGAGRRPGDLDAPWGLFMPVAGAQPRTRDLQVSSVLVSMLA